MRGRGWCWACALAPQLRLVFWHGLFVLGCQGSRVCIKGEEHVENTKKSQGSIHTQGSLLQHGMCAPLALRAVVQQCVFSRCTGVFAASAAGSRQGRHVRCTIALGGSLRAPSSPPQSVVDAAADVASHCRQCVLCARCLGRLALCPVLAVLAAANSLLQLGWGC